MLKACWSPFVRSYDQDSNRQPLVWMSGTQLTAPARHQFTKNQINIFISVLMYSWSRSIIRTTCTCWCQYYSNQNVFLFHDYIGYILLHKSIRDMVQWCLLHRLTSVAFPVFTPWDSSANRFCRFAARAFICSSFDPPWEESTKCSKDVAKINNTYNTINRCKAINFVCKNKNYVFLLSSKLIGVCTTSICIILCNISHN